MREVEMYNNSSFKHLMEKPEENAPEIQDMDDTAEEVICGKCNKNPIENGVCIGCDMTEDECTCA